MFVAPGGAGPGGASHHPAPVFGAGAYGPKPDWSAILDELPYGLIVLGPKQEVRHENSACRQLTGYGVAETGGIEGWLSALCPDTGHRENVIASWREHIWRTQLTRTFTLRTAAQKPKEIEFRSSLLRDGGIALMIEDVTEVRRSEESLRLGKLKFRALFTHTRTGTVLVDRTGRIIDANPAFVSLCGNSLKDLRLSTFASLLHPDEAAALGEAEAALLRELAESPPAARAREARTVDREVWLRTRSGERRLRLAWCPVGLAPEADPSAVPAAPAMGLYLVDPPDPESASERIKARLKMVSRKAQALLNSVPDLILLIDADGTVADFAPPPQPWRELAPDGSWRHRPAAEVWPVLGNLLGRCRRQILEEGRAVQAEIRGPGDEGFEFSVNLSACGDGQILAVVRNQSERRAAREREQWQTAAFAHAPVAMLRVDGRGRVAEANPAAAALLGAGTAELAGRELSPLLDTALPAGTSAEFLALEHEGRSRGSLVFLKPVSPGTGRPAMRVDRPTPAGPPRERRQHGLRNQLQLVTSLFSLEPQSAPAREAFLKWQVRLRAIAQACPYDDTSVVWVHPLLCELADEICSLVGRGPGRREVVVTGDEGLLLDAGTATPFALLLGEIMRLVLATRQAGPGASLYIHLRAEAEGGFRLIVRPGAQRSFVFTDREAEIETLELLTEQIQGRLEATDAAHPSKEWVLIVPSIAS